MTVATDPENPKNKCLKIEYTGDTQAYDYAPIFNLKLQKKLDEYSGIKFESRVVASIHFLPFEQYYYIIGTKTQCFSVFFCYICIVYVNEVCQ